MAGRKKGSKDRKPSRKRAIATRRYAPKQGFKKGHKALPTPEHLTPLTGKKINESTVKEILHDLCWKLHTHKDPDTKKEVRECLVGAATRALWHLVLNGDSMVRLHAANSILDRAFGKPKITADVNVSNSNMITLLARLEAVKTDERAVIADSFSMQNNGERPDGIQAADVPELPMAISGVGNRRREDDPGEHRAEDEDPAPVRRGRGRKGPADGLVQPGPDPVAESVLLDV